MLSFRLYFSDPISNYFILELIGGGGGDFLSHWDEERVVIYNHVSFNSFIFFYIGRPYRDGDHIGIFIKIILQYFITTK